MHRGGLQGGGASKGHARGRGCSALPMTLYIIMCNARARSGGRRVEGGSKIKEELNAGMIDKARKPQGAPKVRIKLD